MKKILLNAVAILGIIFLSLYLSFPILLKWGIDRQTQKAGYSFDMKGLSFQFPSIQIHKVRFTEEKTKKETEFSNFRFELNLRNLMQGEIAFSQVSVDEIKGLNAKGSFFLKSLNLAGEISCKFFHFLFRIEPSSGKFLFHTLKVADHFFKNIMVSVEKTGQLKAFSQDLNLEGSFSVHDDGVAYDLFLKSGLVNFLGRNMIQLEGKYLFQNNGIQAIIKSYLYNSAQAQIDLKVDGDFEKLSVTPTRLYLYERDFIIDPLHNLLVLKMDPWGIFGEFNFSLEKFDQLGDFISGKPEQTFLKISGLFEGEGYNIKATGNKFLIGSLFKVSDFYLSVDSKKHIELNISNKEKTNFLFKGVYDDSKIKNIYFQGNYRGTPIKANKTELDFDKVDIDLSVGQYGRFSLKHANSKTQIYSKKIPATILNNAIKNQNILFEDGVINFDAEYKAGGEGYLSIKMIGLKSSAFDRVFGKIDFDAKLASYALSSNCKMELGREGFLSAKYATPDVKHKFYDPLLSSYDVKGDLRVDGLSDFLKMHDDTLSGRLEFSLKKPSGKFSVFNVALKKGYFEHSSSGVILKNIDLEILKYASDDYMNISLKCRDDFKGIMNGSGRFSLSPSNYDMSGSGKLMLKNFKLLNNQEYQTSGSGELSIVLSPKEKKIFGNIVIEDFLGYMIPKKDFEIIDIEIANKQEKNEKIEVERNSDIGLDIHFSVPKNSFKFYGSGLESNWSGDLKMRGALNSPHIDGRLDAFNGYFMIAGKKLDFLKAYLLFENTLDPYIYVATDANASNIDAKILYHGLLSNAKLEIISIPALPQEEVISQILFSKSASQIKGPAQIIQLADVIAIFNGGASITGFLDKFRQIGIDEIGIREDVSSEVFKTSSRTDPGVFTIGKNLGERFFVRADRTAALDYGKTRGVIGVKLTPELSLEAIGEKSDQLSNYDFGVGFEWKKDF